MTNPLVFRTLTQSALEIGRIPAKAMARFQTSASSLSATRRTAIRREASDTLYADPPPGSHANVDLTHFFERNSDGYVCAAIFLDRSTWALWLGPMKSKTCAEFVRVLDEFRQHVRTTNGLSCARCAPTTIHALRIIAHGPVTMRRNWIAISGTSCLASQLSSLIPHRIINP